MLPKDAATLMQWLINGGVSIYLLYQVITRILSRNKKLEEDKESAVVEKLSWLNTEVEQIKGRLDKNNIEDMKAKLSSIKDNLAIISQGLAVDQAKQESNSQEKEKRIGELKQTLDKVDGDVRKMENAITRLEAKVGGRRDDD